MSRNLLMATCQRLRFIFSSLRCAYLLTFPLRRNRLSSLVIPGPIMHPLQHRMSRSLISPWPCSNSLSISTNDCRPLAVITSPLARSSSMSAACSMPRVRGNREPRPASGGSKSEGSTPSGVMPASSRRILSSANVRTSSMSWPASRSSASFFLAMQGPMKTIPSWSPCMAFRTLAMAIIGETTGASSPTRSGWYIST